MKHPIRRIAAVAKVFAASLVVAACVTINVYFPAAAAEKAADQIIDAVTGAAGSAEPRNAPRNGSPPRASTQSPMETVLVATVGRALELIVPAAHAQQANLDISSPEIRTIVASMNGRFGQLKKYFDSGVVGYTQNGEVAVRDAAAAPLPERAVVTRLVAEDNKDREALYAEIAKANGHPEWLDDIKKTFGRRWVERAAAGTWYQDAGGAWKSK